MATSDGVEQVIILGQGCRYLSQGTEGGVGPGLKGAEGRISEQPGLKRNRSYDILPEEVIRQMKEAAAEDKQD